MQQYKYGRRGWRLRIVWNEPLVFKPGIDAVKMPLASVAEHHSVTQSEALNFAGSGFW